MNEKHLSTQTLFTIGHSNHELDQFVELLHQHNVTAIADVRSSPYSRFNPQFNRDVLEIAMRRHRIHYAYVGDQLGARRSETDCYVDRKARYDLIAKTPTFAEGLSRIRRGLADHQVALMCAEKDPLMCHRTILICRHLRESAIEIAHILEDGSLESMRQAEDRLLALMRLPSQNLFRSKDELIEEAYDKQAEKIAYVEPKPALNGVKVL